MKTKLLMLTLALAGLIFTSCDKDDDNIQVSPEIESAFRSQYPDITRAEWEQKYGYYVAEFINGSREAEAWYNPQAVWYMTETDVRYADLPAAVKTAFEAGDYAAWRIDDIDRIECLDMEMVYIIEVEQGNTEYDLYYSPEGVFIKAVLDENGSAGHQPSAVLPAVKEYVAANYPQARIVDIDRESNGIEVDIVDGNISRELLFSPAGEWMHTKTEVRKLAVPSVVLSALSASEYGSWQIDDIDHYLTATDEYYLFELESGDREMDLKIDTDGNII